MKIWLLLSFCTLVCGSSFTPRRVIQTSNREWETSQALTIPRGGVTVLGLSPDISTKIFIFHCITHIRSFFDPNGHTRAYLGRNLENDYQLFPFQTGSVAVLCQAAMAYLAAYKNADVVEISKIGNIPRVAYFIIQLITGAYKKAGVSTKSITFLTVVVTLLELALWFNVGDPKLVAKLFLVPPMLQGITGCIAPTANARIWGVDISKSTTSQFLQKWMAAEVLASTLIPAVMLFGGSWQQSVGCSLITMALFCFDAVFVTKLAIKSKIPLGAFYIVTAVYSLLASTLLM